MEAPKKYTIHFFNFGYSSDNQPDNLDDAKKVARRAGFESVIYEDGEAVMTFSPLYGFRKY